jgi:hypothetical protein
MTWMLSASGHTPAPEGETGWEEVEQRLHDELAAVLRKPEYGASSTSFSGNHVRGNALHLPADDPDVTHTHDTTDDSEQRAGETDA